MFRKWPLEALGRGTSEWINEWIGYSCYETASPCCLAPVAHQTQDLLTQWSLLTFWKKVLWDHKTVTTVSILISSMFLSAEFRKLSWTGYPHPSHALSRASCPVTVYSIGIQCWQQSDTRVAQDTSLESLHGWLSAGCAIDLKSQHFLVSSQGSAVVSS